MSDCEKCWDTPCSCGYGYTHMTEEMEAAESKGKYLAANIKKEYTCTQIEG